MELTREAWEAFERGDVAFMQALMGPHVTIVQPPEIPDAKSYDGRDAALRAWEDWPEQWEDFRLELIDVIDVSDDVLISVTRQSGRGRESGIDMDFEVYFVSRGQPRKTERIEMFFSREQALKAAGVEE